MDISPEVLQLGTKLAESMARNGATMISDKIRAVRASGRQEDVIAGLEEIISDLLDDKSELTRIAQSYQSELVSQQLTSGDVRYIADTVFPLLEAMADAGLDEENEKLKQLEAMKPLLSVETVNVLQLLGFNFRRAIGEPLTALMEGKILSSVNRSQELQLESMRNQRALVELARDPDAYERFRSLVGAG
jgi:hypothetical protein